MSNVHLHGKIPFTCGTRNLKQPCDLIPADMSISRNNIILILCEQFSSFLQMHLLLNSYSMVTQNTYIIELHMIRNLQTVCLLNNITFKYDRKCPNKYFTKPGSRQRYSI